MSPFRPTQVLGWGILAFALVSLLYAGIRSPRPGVPAAEEPAPQRAAELLLLRGSAYCPTCDKMRDLTERLLGGPLAREVREGRLVFREIDVEAPGNQDYILSYDLMTTALVLREATSHGERYLRLDRGWRLAEEDEPGFLRYVEAETRRFLQETGR